MQARCVDRPLTILYHKHTAAETNEDSGTPFTLALLLFNFSLDVGTETQNGTWQHWLTQTPLSLHSHVRRIELPISTPTSQQFACIAALANHDPHSPRVTPCLSVLKLTSWLGRMSRRPSVVKSSSCRFVLLYRSRHLWVRHIRILVTVFSYTSRMKPHTSQKQNKKRDRRCGEIRETLERLHYDFLP